jgi:L-lactate dehydrogenase
MKIGIVGSGFVGSTTAYALVMRGIGREIVLVDKNVSRANAEADDIYHAVPFAHPLQLKVGDYKDLAGSQVVIIAAGVNQRTGESRLELLGRNDAVFKEVVPKILEHAPEAILVVATNPVDIMTHRAASYAAERGMPASRVIGSGTTLDTARFRALLGLHLGIDPQHVHGYVVGEHGDSEVPAWSLVTVGGIPLEEFCNIRKTVLDQLVKNEIDNSVRHAAYNIISGKGATYYGIGSALARIVEVILNDQRSILTVCSQADEIAGVFDVTVSLPHLVGGEGILATFPLPLSEEEQKMLYHSAKIVREVLDKLTL